MGVVQELPARGGRGGRERGKGRAAGPPRPPALNLKERGQARQAFLGSIIGLNDGSVHPSGRPQEWCR